MSTDREFEGLMHCWYNA